MHKKTFTPLCPKELPVAEGHLIADELNAQAALADLRVMTKDAHHAAAKWLVDNPVDMLKPTGLPDADLTWVSHAMVEHMAMNCWMACLQPKNTIIAFGKASILSYTPTAHVSRY